MSKGMSKEDIIQYLKDSDEYFFITKEDDVFSSIHSNLSGLNEWVDMIEYFKDKLEEKIIGLKKNRDALNDLLTDEDISLN